MYLQLKDNFCVGISEFPVNEEHFAENETQVAYTTSESLDELRDKLGWVYQDGELVEPEKSEEQVIAEENEFYTELLKETDWYMMRHRDQVELGVPTSLSDEQYKALLQLRQDARDNYREADPPPDAESEPTEDVDPLQQGEPPQDEEPSP